MNEFIIPLAGYLAGALTTLAYLPQALKALRERHTRDLSLMTYILLNTGLVLWLVYGILLGNWPLIIPNAVTLCFTIPILIMKIRLG